MPFTSKYRIVSIVAPGAETNLCGGARIKNIKMLYLNSHFGEK